MQCLHFSFFILIDEMWILQWVMTLIQSWLMWYVYAMEFYLSMKENEICRKISGNGNYITRDNPESERQILRVLSHVLIQMSTFYRCVLMWKWVCVESKKQGRDQWERKRLYRRGVGRVIEHIWWEGGSGVIRVIRGGLGGGSAKTVDVWKCRKTSTL